MTERIRILTSNKWYVTTGNCDEIFFVPLQTAGPNKSLCCILLLRYLKHRSNWLLRLGIKQIQVSCMESNLCWLQSPQEQEEQSLHLMQWKLLILTGEGGDVSDLQLCLVRAMVCQPHGPLHAAWGRYVWTRPPHLDF